MSLRLRSDSPATTRALGGVLAGAVRGGDVLALSGELGAGKTCLVQGLAAGLGATERVTSPTFLLARRIETTPPLVHADAWRLRRISDLLDLGDDVLAHDVVTVLEWGDAVVAALPGDRLEVDLVVDGTTADAPREVALRGCGAWEPRLADLAADLDAVAA